MDIKLWDLVEIVKNLDNTDMVGVRLFVVAINNVGMESFYDLSFDKNVVSEPLVVGDRTFSTLNNWKISKDWPGDNLKKI